MKFASRKNHAVARTLNGEINVELVLVNRVFFKEGPQFDGKRELEERGSDVCVMRCSHT